MIACPSCGRENPEGFRFCVSCGTTLGRTCSNCGAVLEPGFRFCGVCGRPVSATDEPSGPSEPAVLGDRRQVTVVFADIVGYASLAERMDPEELRAFIREAFAEMAAEVEDREGTVEKFIGDAIMVVFGVPVAHEDDPDRAVETARAMLEVAQRRSTEVGTALRLRVGINSGKVVAGTVGDGTQTGVMGDAVNVAARLQQAAAPGEILIEASVWRRVRDRYDAEPVGPLEVKGRERPVHAFRITGLGTPTVRKQAPFVGRREELALLELLWSSAVKGNTHVVSLTGEPGVGKTRLLSEFPRREGAHDVRVVSGRERPFGPFIQVLESFLGRSPHDSDDLLELSRAIGVDEETARLLAAILGLGDAPPVVAMADEHQKRQVFAGVWQFLLAATAGRPTLIVLDDVHVADRSSLDLLVFLLDRLGGVPILLVLASRPSFDHVTRGSLRASHTAVHLEPLTPSESVGLARGFLGVAELPEDLERLVASRAEGNPFFIEELLQALLELESLAVVDGKAILARVDIHIPECVEGTILARVDRLDQSKRLVLQHAAVIGRTFSTDLIEAVMAEEDLGSVLEELARGQLLVAEAPGRWAFKHSLIWEVAYETLLLRQRRDIHRKVAEELEARAGSDPIALEYLAEHFAQAEIPDKARRYALAAGDAAADRMGFVEARARYETALRLWGEGDEPGRLSLLMKLGWACLIAGDPAGARTALIEAEAGWRRLGDVHQAGAALATLGRVYFFAADIDRASATLKSAIELLSAGGSSPDLMRAVVWASIQDTVTGRVEEGTALATEGLRMADELHLDDARSHLLTSLGRFEFLAGELAGVDRIRWALDLAQQVREVEAIGRAYINLSLCLAELSDNREGVAVARRGRETMSKLGAPSFEWVIGCKEAEMLVEIGSFADAEDLCRQILGPYRAVVVVPALVFASIALARSLFRRGLFGESQRLIDEGVPMARRIGGSLFLSPILTVEAELEEARGNLAFAREVLTESIEVAASSASVPHWFGPLVAGARLLPDGPGGDLLRQVRERATHPAFQAPLLEAEAVVETDEAMFAKAADLYASLDLPYQEARCRLEAGDLDRAGQIVSSLGIGSGPLGARLRER